MFFVNAGNFADYRIAATVFSVIYLLIQSVLLVDFAHIVAENWLLKHEEGSKFYKVCASGWITKGPLTNLNNYSFFSSAQHSPDTLSSLR